MDLDRLRELAGIVTEKKKRDLGKVVFGDFKQADEPDTKFEQKLFRALAHYIRDPTIKNAEKAKKMLSAVRNQKHLYPDDLLPDPGVKYVYRGTAVKSKKIQPYIDFISHGERVTGMNEIAVPFNYTSRSPISSWTTDQKIAMMFAYDINDPGGNSRTPVVIRAEVDDSFILNTNLTGKLGKYYIDVNESEIIRIDSSPIKADAIIVESQRQADLDNAESIDLENLYQLAKDLGIEL